MSGPDRLRLVRGRVRGTAGHDGMGDRAARTARVAAHVARALVEERAAHPALGAACIAARGLAGEVDTAAWARRLGIAKAVVDAAEAGVLPPHAVPAALAAAADGAWAGWRDWPA